MVKCSACLASLLLIGCGASHAAGGDAAGSDGGADAARPFDAAGVDAGEDAAISDGGSDAGSTCKPPGTTPGSRWIDDAGLDWQWCNSNADCAWPGQRCLFGVCCSGEVHFPGCACTCPGDVIGLAACPEGLGQLCCYGRGIGPRAESLVCRTLDDCASTWAEHCRARTGPMAG